MTAETLTQRRLLEAQERIAAIAAEMGVEVDDLLGFVHCLRVWIDKGFSYERAIEANLETWHTLLVNMSAATQSEASRYRPALEVLKRFAVDVVHDHVRSAA